MLVYPSFKNLTPVDIPLDNIYLDPNNPRFVGITWKRVPDQEIQREYVQQVVKRLMKKFDVDRLCTNMEVNGFLPIDRVVVRKFSEDKYVVLEGNRRICAAKIVSESADNSSTIGDDIRNSFRQIPCLLYTGSKSDAAWAFQGLRHITGIKEWPSFNKAKLVVEQMENERLTLTEVGRIFGLTPHRAGRWARSFYAFKQASENSDFINEVEEESYPHFQELFHPSSIEVRKWLEWDESYNQFNSTLKFNEFISWLYPRTSSGGNNSDTEILPVGVWERRWLSRPTDIRMVGFLIREAPNAFQQFRQGKALQKVYSSALLAMRSEEEKSSLVNEILSAIDVCTNALDNIRPILFQNSQNRTYLLDRLDSLEASVSVIKGTRSLKAPFNLKSIFKAARR